MRKIATIEMIDAARLARTALSSPNVTVFSDTKSRCFRSRDVMNLTATKAATKIAT